MRPSLEVTKKVGNILTKFGDFFWESQNLVKNQVINFSPKIVNQDIVEYFSPNLVKISDLFLVFTKFGENFIRTFVKVLW